MLTIVQALKEDDPFIRVTYEKRWLVWNTQDKAWHVYEQRPVGNPGVFGSPAKLVSRTKDQKTAVAFLLGKR